MAVERPFYQGTNRPMHFSVIGARMASFTAALATEVSPDPTTAVKMTGEIIANAAISVSFTTLNGNNPKANGNRLVLFPSDGIPIPWGSGGGIPTRLEQSDFSGDLFLTPKLEENQSYIVAYAVGEEDTTICSTLQFTPGYPTGVPDSISLDILAVGSESLLIKYATPSGNDPEANNHYLGLWKGRKPTYSSDDPNHVLNRPILKTTNSAAVPLNNLKLTVSTTYTLSYATGPSPTHLCAYLSFKTQGYA